MRSREKPGRGREYFAKAVGTVLLLAGGFELYQVAQDYIHHETVVSMPYEVVDEQTAAVNSFESIPDANQIGLGAAMSFVGLGFLAKGINIGDRRHEAEIADARRAAARHIQTETL